jgi:hypothetical protein
MNAATLCLIFASGSNVTPWQCIVIQASADLVYSADVTEWYRYCPFSGAVRDYLQVLFIANFNWSVLLRGFTSSCLILSRRLPFWLHSQPVDNGSPAMRLSCLIFTEQVNRFALIDYPDSFYIRLCASIVDCDLMPCRLRFVSTNSPFLLVVISTSVYMVRLGGCWDMLQSFISLLLLLAINVQSNCMANGEIESSVDWQSEISRSHGQIDSLDGQKSCDARACRMPTCCAMCNRACQRTHQMKY